MRKRENEGKTKNKGRKGSYYIHTQVKRNSLIKKTICAGTHTHVRVGTQTRTGIHTHALIRMTGSNEYITKSGPVQWV